ncbi:SCO family protein [Magnetofaba australis]|uniref:Putative Classical-complement-pathway C3/C5 convertase n=1 Tax=Magnetofaba australis IT-1 TaxID=1434232 RepID=A0A1Y2K138_9PROT|nr:SCO family protein [Magnetofaba australis]OSM01682.1 putative Classical-complement-pathway C3/C5 convertase [Magnetofaba australis IT-1]
MNSALPTVTRLRLAAVILLFCLVTALLTAPPSTRAEGGVIPIHGDFSLLDENGRAVTLKDYRGRYLLLYFGYTFCPDVCPTNLGIMAQALEMLPKPTVEKITPLFISIDPERDTVEVVKEYTDLFHPAIIGLSARAPADAMAAARSFGVFFAKDRVDPQHPMDYTVSHSSNTMLLDPLGRMLEIFPHATAPEQLVKTILKRIH